MIRSSGMGYHARCPGRGLPQKAWAALEERRGSDQGD